MANDVREFIGRIGEIGAEIERTLDACTAAPRKEASADALAGLLNLSRHLNAATKELGETQGRALRVGSAPSWEREYRSLADNMPDNVARWDRQHRYLYLNRTHERLLGRAASEIVGNALNDDYFAPRLNPALDQVWQSGRTLTLMQPVPMPGHEVRTHEIRLIPERDENDNIVAILGVGRDVTEQLRLQETLVAQESKFRSLAENLPDQIARWDAHGCFAYANRAAAEMFGLLANDLVGTEIGDQHGELKKAVARVLAGHPSPLEVRQRMRDMTGKELLFEFNIILERDASSGAVGILGIGRNVTEQAGILAALEAKERDFRAMAENSLDNIGRWGRNRCFLYINPRLSSVLGVSQEEAVGEAIDAVRFPEMLEIVDSVFRTGAEVLHVPQHLVDERGEEKIHDINFIPERDPHGTVVSVLAIGRDMTDAIRTREALEQREREYLSLTENLPHHVARYTPQAKTLYFSPRLERLLGVTTREVLGTTPCEHWNDGRYTEYEALLKRVGSTGCAASLEVLAPDERGVPSIYQLEVIPERDEQGEIVSVLAISHNITDAKRSEADLRMAASVFEAANEGIAIADPEGTILKVNPAFTQLCGHEARDVVGTNYLHLQTGPDGSLPCDVIRVALRDEGCWSGDVDWQHKSGESITIRLSISPVCDDVGTVLYYVGIFSDISQAKQHEVQLQYIAHHDVLTGLPNRILLMDRLQLAIARAKRSGEMLAVLFIDLDGFKPINDSLGHGSGDRTLVLMGQRMVRCLRSSDTVARIGGDEFVVLLPALSDPAECEVATRKLLKAIGEPTELDGCTFTLSASVGIALYPKDGVDADSLLRRADEAMYVAKRTGRSQYVLCGEDERPSYHANGSSVHELRRALEQQQIEVHYQPIVDLRSGRITKAEALVRWRHPERGLISPAEFIPLAEETGLIHALGTRVFAHALEVARRWNQLCPGGKPHRISVNRSPREFLDSHGVETWMESLERYGEDMGRMLSVEITEGLLLDDRPRVLDQLKQLRARGMTIALDDFGTGFSSLAYLKKFDIDYLKIDRSFILNIESDPSDRVIVESVIAMARQLGIRIIAEGVETQAQAEILAGSRCDYVQGYLYSRPLPVEAFLELAQRTERVPLEVPMREADATRSSTLNL